MSPSAGTRVVPFSYEPGRLLLLDQRRLPHEEVLVACEGAGQTVEAIRSLAVRGAPLIGVAAAYGLCAEARHVAATAPGEFDVALARAAEELAAARPTAVNLPAAVTRMRQALARSAGRDLPARVAFLEREAAALAEEDREACARLGRAGAEFLRRLLPPRPGTGAPLTLLTHCNAGALATAGIGTALGIVRALAAEEAVAVLADETRPFLQGARLTAWELARDGVPVTLLPDAAAAATIASGRVHAVLVGADRIARSGDVANKVGTYGLALACRAHAVPFLVAAPTTTLDPGCPDGAAIPIEMRESEEVLAIPTAAGGAVRIAPEGVGALYPAFDVTPAALVTAIVTERGISTPPHGENLRALLP